LLFKNLLDNKIPTINSTAPPKIPDRRVVEMMRAVQEQDDEEPAELFATYKALVGCAIVRLPKVADVDPLWWYIFPGKAS
jgi:hypothetical protein